MIRQWTVEGSKEAIEALAKIIGKARIQQSDGTKEPLEYEWWGIKEHNYIRIIDEKEGEMFFYRENNDRIQNI